MNTLQHFHSTLGCRESQPSVAPLDRGSMEWRDARSRFLHSLTCLDAGDLACEPEVVAALKTEDPAEIGRVMLGKLTEYLNRLADREAA